MARNVTHQTTIIKMSIWIDKQRSELLEKSKANAIKAVQAMFPDAYPRAIANIFAELGLRWPEEETQRRKPGEGRDRVRALSRTIIQIVENIETEIGAVPGSLFGNGVKAQLESLRDGTTPPTETETND